MQYVRFKDYIKPGASSLILGAIITLVLWYDLYLPIGLSECQGENLCLGDSPLVDFFLNSAYIRSWRGILFSFILEFVVTSKNFSDLVFDEFSHVVSCIGEILTWIEVIWM